MICSDGLLLGVVSEWKLNVSVLFVCSFSSVLKCCCRWLIRLWLSLIVCSGDLGVVRCLISGLVSVLSLGLILIICWLCVGLIVVMIELIML